MKSDLLSAYLERVFLNEKKLLNSPPPHDFFLPLPDWPIFGIMNFVYLCWLIRQRKNQAVEANSAMLTFSFKNTLSK